MKTLVEYNRELEAKLQDLLSEVLSEGERMDNLLWIETRSGVLCPKCKEEGRSIEMRILYPRVLAEGFLCQVVVHCTCCDYEGTMLNLGNKKRWLEHLREFFPSL